MLRFIRKKKSISDLLMVWGGTIAGALAGVATQMTLARALGPHDYGILSGVWSIVALLVPLAVFGTTQYWLKIFGEEGWSALRWVQPSLRFLTLSTTLIVLIFSWWAVFGPNDPSSQFVMLALVFWIVANVSVEVVGAKFQLEQRYGLFALMGALPPVLRLVVAALVFISFSKYDKLEFAAVGYLLTSIVLILSLAPQILKFHSKKVDLRGHGTKEQDHQHGPPTIKWMLAHSWVFGIAGLMYLAWAQGHVVIAKYALGNNEAGFYSAALVILNAICLLPSVAFSKFFLPKIHRWAAQDFRKLKNFSNRASAIMLLAGIVAAVLLFIVSDIIVRITFGSGYESVAFILQVLAFTLPMRFLGYNAGAMLRTQRFMLIKVIVLFFAVLLNLVLASMFIPLWGLTGLAATVPITEFFLVGTYIYFMKFHYFKNGQTSL